MKPLRAIQDRRLKRILLSALTLSLVLATAMPMSALTSSQASSQLNQTQQALSDLAAQKKAAKKNLLKDKQARDKIVQDLVDKGYEKEQIEARIAEIESAIATLEAAIADAEAEYDCQLKLFQTRMVALYQHKRAYTDVLDTLSGDSLTDLIRNAQAMKTVAASDQAMMESLAAKKAEIAEMKAQKQQEEENAESQLESSLKQIDELTVSRSSAEARVSKSAKSVAQLDKEEDQLEAEAQELGDLIRKLQSTGKYIGGTMQWPTPGYESITSPFGYRIHPILKYKKFHGGIDINAPKGAYIHAAADGTVISARWHSGGSGYTVILDHGGGISTFYLHIMKGGILVKEGQSVKAGDVIAKVGSTGLSTGPHLHFEVRKDGERQSPLKYVTGK